MEKRVVLFDVDSKISNFALMKLSAYYKQLGYTVILTKEIVKIEADLYFASVVFYCTRSLNRVQKLKDMYGDQIEIGGSGVDLKKRLPAEIENCFPDYGLYKHDNYAVGFLTRGCDNKCKFCLVPEKEGPKRLVATFDDFMPKNQQKLLLLDDNLLSFPEAKGFLQEMAKHKYAVNFSQSLDIPYLTEETLNLLLQVDSTNSKFNKRMYYFSCNHRASMAKFYEKKDLLKSFGRESVTVIMMYGFNTHLSDEYEILDMMHNIGLIPFMQEYHPLADIPSLLSEDYFDFDLDKVIELPFRTNGQNGEKYLRWLSKRYFETYGKYYLPLLQKIYRYNRKERLNWYLNRPEIITKELYTMYEKEESIVNKKDDVRSFSGRDFTAKELELIKEARQNYPHLTRTGLSKLICNMINWVDEAGKTKKSACRTFLEILEQEGEIDLPPISESKVRPKKEKKAEPLEINDEVINCKYSQLQPVSLKLISAGRELKRWRKMIDKYHMLGDKQVFGTRLHYFIMSGDREIGCLQFSASAWALADRDLWIGWDVEDKKQRLNLIINNSRFLIFPWVKVKYLASASLAMAAKRVPVDWLKIYYYAPVLLETFVDLDHFQGTCYKAANWVLLGETRGRGRMDTTHLRGLSPKAIFMYPLQKDFRECLKGTGVYNKRTAKKQPQISKSSHTEYKVAEFYKKNNSLRKNGRMRKSTISNSEVMALRNQGLSYHAIIKQTSLSLNTIRNVLNEVKSFAYTEDEEQFKDGLITFERKADVRGLVCEGKFISNLNTFIERLSDHKDSIFTIETRHNSYIKQYIVHIKEGSIGDQGTIIYQDGSLYKGQIKEGYPHGLGIKTGRFATDEGQFIDGFISCGIRTSSNAEANKTVYEGEFSNNVCNGKGKLKFPNGEIHEGQWQDDEMVGIGKVIYPNGGVHDLDKVLT